VLGPILLFGGTGMVGHNTRDLAAERNIEIVAPAHAEVDLLNGKAVLAAVRRYAPRS
jgi:dTDP-4-dehydrorhamnose reductase